MQGFPCNFQPPAVHKVSTYSASSMSDLNDVDDTEEGVKKRKHVGPFALGRMVGQGAFGKVKLGTNIFTGEKIISYKNVKTKREKHQIDREREILLRLNHPNIVNLKKVVDDEKRNKCYMIFEYVAGGELFDYIVSHGRLSERDARKFMRQYCHSMLVIHRDLKPENLLLDENLNIKISDFGLSNIMEPGKRFATFCGSLHYACPEILRGEKYLGPGVDIWSMGIILYCLVVGRQPWDGANAEDLIHAILEDGLEVPQGISDECVNLILSMLRVSEEDRIPISKMRFHPWIMEEYGEPPPSYLPPSDLITSIDSEIMEQLIIMGFVDDKEKVTEKKQKLAKDEEKKQKRLERQEKKKKKAEKEKKAEAASAGSSASVPVNDDITNNKSTSHPLSLSESPSRSRRSQSVSTSTGHAPPSPSSSGSQPAPPTISSSSTSNSPAFTSPRAKKPKKLVITTGNVTPEKMKKPSSKKSSANVTTSSSTTTLPSSPSSGSPPSPASPLSSSATALPPSSAVSPPSSPIAIASRPEATKKSSKKSKTPTASPINKVAQAERRPRSSSLSSGPAPPPKFDRATNEDEYETSSDETPGSSPSVNSGSPMGGSHPANVSSGGSHSAVTTPTKFDGEEGAAVPANPKLAEVKQKGDQRRGRSASVSPHIARPIFSLEEVKNKSPTKTPSKKKAAVPARTSSAKRPTILDNDLFKGPDSPASSPNQGSPTKPSGDLSASGKGNSTASATSTATTSASNGATSSSTEKLNQTTNTTTLVADTTTTQPVEKIVQEILRVFDTLGIKHKKVRDQYIYTGTTQEQGEVVKIELEIVSINKFTNLRGIVVRRSVGDVWAYKAVYEKIVKELKV